MNKIYCLMTGGGSLVDETRDALFTTAQDMISRKDRIIRLKKSEHGIDGEMKTDYKFGFMGSIGGIMFSAHFDSPEADQHIKTDFIVRPLRNRDEAERARWRPAPLFPLKEPNPISN